MRARETLAQRDRRLPAEQLARAGDVGPARVGSSTGSGSNTISDVEPVTSITMSASSSIVNSSGLPMFTGSIQSESSERDDAAHFVVDIAERTGLAAVAVHR